MTEKILGYVLLVIGVAIIVSSGISVYKVFTKQSAPIQLFNFPSVSIDATSLVGGDLTPAQREMVKQSMGNTSMELLPANILNDSSNVVAHLMFMGFIASIGFKLAALGTMLVRTIVVKVKEASSIPAKPSLIKQ